MDLSAIMMRDSPATALVFLRPILMPTICALKRLSRTYSDVLIFFRV